MDDLAEELGISKKTLYAHFPGKIDLLEAVLADKFSSVEAALKEATRAHPDDFPATLHELLAGTQRELDEIKPPFVRDMRQKARSARRNGAQGCSGQSHYRDFAGDGSSDHESAKDGRARDDAERRLHRNSQDCSRRSAYTKRTENVNMLFVRQDRQSVYAAGALALLLLSAGCSDPKKDRFQGYVEGEFVYVASPLAGQLETLSVQRGQQVTTGQPLFALDEITEKAAREQIEAALVLSERELARQEKLFRTGVAATQDLDRARSARDQDKRRLDQTNWSFDQKKQAAPQSGLVYDTLFRQGEWVAAGKPVVVLLPPQNIKVRAFIPETRVGSIHYGNIARVKVDGVKDSFVGKVSYISPRAEYTPPVIYSRETRAKLVFMVELIFDAQAAANLHPGQPVDVEFEPK